MRPAFIDHLRVVIMGRRPSHDNDRLRISFITGDPDPTFLADDHLAYRAFVEIGFSQIAPKGAEDLIREKSTRVIARFVYKEVVDELQTALEELWATGHDKHPAALRIAKLINDLEMRE